MIRLWRVFIIICILLSGSAVFAYGTDGGRTIRVGYTGHPGFIEQKADGSYAGLGIEYFNEVARYTGWNYEYISGSREALQEALQQGQIDLIAPVMKTTDRRSTVYDYPQHAIGTAVSGLYVRESNTEIYFDDYAHMQGIRIGGHGDPFR